MHFAELSGWLRIQRPEMERMTLARVYGVSDPVSMEDPEYVGGLRAAVSAALNYGLTGIERGAEQAGFPPSAILMQARYAARSGVDLETVLRRCVAGSALLGDFVIQAVEAGEVTLLPEDLGQVWRVQATLLDRLLTTVSAEYRNEIKNRSRNSEERRADQVRKLLAGQFLGPDELHYEFDAWHIGVIACGPDAQGRIRSLAAGLDRQLLLVLPGSDQIWAWLGGRRKVTTKDIQDFASMSWPGGLSVALGEPERGMAGWRLTHRQAKAATPIAQRPVPRVVRYADVTLLAAALHDEVLASSLERLYLDPLACERDGGFALRQTLRAFFRTGRSVSSTAAAIGVSRQTVSSRLRNVESRVGRPIDACAPEIDTALRLFDLRQSETPTTRKVGR